LLAEAGKQKLTLSQFEKQMENMPPQLKMMLKRNPKIQEQFLDRWVDVALFSQEAKAKKMDQSPSFKARLNDLKNALLAQEFMQKEIQGKVKATEEDKEKYYKEHAKEFTQPAMVKASHILIMVDKEADAKTVKAAEAKAKGLKAKLNKGADFAELAKKYSDDPGSKPKGGDLGFFPKGRMVPEFEKAVFSMKKGQISDPVKSKFGYHIIMVEDIKEEKVKPMSEVDAQLQQRVTMQKQQALKDKITKGLMAKYPVKVFKENLPPAPKGQAPMIMPRPGMPMMPPKAK
jgi:peptidyl-prolyl cis-trans isomerase C